MNRSVRGSVKKQFRPFPDHVLRSRLFSEGTDCMNLPMSWDEWADHDGVALAARVAKGELTAAELAAQAAAGIAKVDPALSAVVEIFEDAVTDPATCGTNLDGPFAGLP